MMELELLGVLYDVWFLSFYGSHYPNFKKLVV